jgi:hypothetical protein
MGLVKAAAALLLAAAGGVYAATPMTEAEFQGFLDAANSELQQKQERLGTDYGLDDVSTWGFDQATEKLQFFDEQMRLVVEADVIDAGSYSPKSISWKWAWGNESVLPALRKKAEKLRELQAITGVRSLANRWRSRSTTNMAWELAAMAARHLGALGCYRAPAKETGPWIFLLIMKIRKTRVPMTRVIARLPL